MKRTIIIIIIVSAVIAPLGARGEESAGLSREQRVELVSELLDAEPSAFEVRDVALRYYELNPSELNRVRRTLRSKAGAPYFVVSERYQHVEDDRELRVNTPAGDRINKIDDQYRSNATSTNGILSWDLPISIMSDSEFQTYQLSRIQRQIIMTVNTWYFSRRQLMLELLVDPPRDPRALTSLRIRVEGFTALIDTYTGGWFSRQLPELPPELHLSSPGGANRQ